MLFTTHRLVWAPMLVVPKGQLPTEPMRLDGTAYEHLSHFDAIWCI
jgi:hypothetical protein